MGSEGNATNSTSEPIYYSMDYTSPENISIPSEAVSNYSSSAVAVAAVAAVNYSSAATVANYNYTLDWGLNGSLMYPNPGESDAAENAMAGMGSNFSDPYANYTGEGWPGNSIYPSGYSELRIILTSFFVTIIMILIVVGNMLVCIAIATEKALKTVQNWFIASLAVSDFLLGLVIMPFSLANELMGYWIFGRVWCDIHSALDVLLCTASINNLCLISLDRYWSVTQAVEYLKKRTPSRALFMICFVWALSALISLPPLVGWNKRSKKSDYPTCELSDDIGYVLYSAFGSFYIPAVVMVFVYIRIFIAARSRARRHVKKRHHLPELTNDPVKEKSTTTTTCTSFSNPSPPERGKDDDDREPSTPTDHLLPRKENGASGSAGCGSVGGVSVISPRGTPDSLEPALKIEGAPNKKPRPTSVVLNATPQIIIETPRESPRSSPSPRRPRGRFHSEDGDDEGFDEDQERTAFFGDDDENAEDSDFPRVYHLGRDLRPGDGGLRPFPGQYGGCGGTLAVNGCSPTGLPDPAAAPVEPTARTGLLSAVAKRGKSPFGSTMSLADYERSDPDAYEAEDSGGGGNSSVKSATGKKVKKVHKVKYQCDPLPARHTASDAERHKRKVAKARERRATLILGLIMAAFILAWLPFFVLYVLEALCSTCTISPTGFAVAFWLGYCNSALNPIIYTIFNRDFRRAFRKILFK